MSNDSDKKEHNSDNNSVNKPDPETLHTTDPQEHMDGPLSSLMKKAGDGFEDDKNSGDDEDKQNS